MSLLPACPRLLVAALLGLLVALLPAVALAQSPGDRDEDFLLRVSGDVTIAEGDRVGTLVVISGNATIDGTVDHDLIVVSGNVVINGTVGDDVTVISGDIRLADGAVVNNVTSISGNVTQDPGATVQGNLRERDGLTVPLGALAALSVYFWLASTVFVVVSGLIFAAIGGAQLTRAALTMTQRAVNTIVGGVFFWVGLPILAAILMATLVGLPLGFAVFVIVMPAVWFLGYITAGARLGSAILGRFGREGGTRPYAAVAFGLLLLQLTLLIPGLGLLIVVLAGIWGGAALAYTAFAAAGGRSFEAEPASPTPPAPPPATA